MQLDRPLRTVTPSLDSDVLTVLALADASFSGRRVQQLIGERSEPGVRRVLDRLVEQGIVSVRRAGQAKMYELNRRHLAAPYIEGLARLKAELVARLRDHIGQWSPAPRYAALFGSAARGHMRSDSDIDLFVVRPDTVEVDDVRWRQLVNELSLDVTAWTGNDARFLEMSESEVGAALKAADPLLVSLQADGIALGGTLPRRRSSSRDRRA